MCASGKLKPQSMRTALSPYSMTLQFFPISPIPPRQTSRTFLFFPIMSAQAGSGFIATREVTRYLDVGGREEIKVGADYAALAFDGFHHTRKKAHYAARLFAVLIDNATHIHQQDISFTQVLRVDRKRVRHLTMPAKFRTQDRNSHLGRQSGQLFAVVNKLRFPRCRGGFL